MVCTPPPSSPLRPRLAADKPAHSVFVCSDFSGYSEEYVDDHRVGRTTSRLVRGGTYSLPLL